MSIPKDGGPAFPVPAYVNADGETHYSTRQGMSLRDAFALASLPGIIHGAIVSGSTHEDRNTYEMIASRAYAQADAMLKVRDEKL